MKVRIEPTKTTLNTRELLSQMPKRLKGYLHEFARRMARGTLKKVRETLGRSDASEDYLDALELARLEGPVHVDRALYTVRIHPSARRVKNLTVRRTVLYVYPLKRRSAPAPPEILILRNWGPWTPETIPFTPDRTQAQVFARKVREDEAEAVVEKNDKERVRVLKILSEYGIRPSQKQQGVKIDAQLTVMPDIAFEAMRMEFGLGGVRRQAHWKPSVKDMVSTGARGILRSKDFMDTLTRVRSTTWRRWPKRVHLVVPAAEVRTLRKFEKETATRPKR